MRAIVPYRVLTASLMAMWLLLSGLTAGNLVLAAVVALIAGQTLRALGERSPRIRRWRAVPELVGIVLYDIVRSNIAVARIILGGDRHNRHSGFVTIPLRLRHPFGLAVLSIIITSTPGTAWVDYNSARNELIIHVFDLVDDEAWIELITNRYESLLLEIYE
jgi:multicomponent K+:H+ antiporter subunit E